jgi:K+-transporting ATPase KdpF subunit
MNVGEIVGLAAAAGLLVYLAFALLAPEWFA